MQIENIIKRYEDFQGMTFLSVDDCKMLIEINNYYFKLFYLNADDLIHKLNGCIKESYRREGIKVIEE